MFFLKKSQFVIGGWKYRLFGRLISHFPLKVKVLMVFFFKMKSLPRLSSPITFNEKIQWRKVYGHSPYFTSLADKLASKKIVSYKAPGVIVPKVYWEGESADSIVVENLPADYVIKANHGSAMNLIVRNSQHYSKERIQKYFDRWRLHDQSSVLGEKAYADIKPRFFIEEYLDFGSTVPVDYKFFVYHGHVKFVQVDTGRFDFHYRNMMTREWQDLGINYSHPALKPSPKKPENFSSMISYAEAIADKADFLRVDLYSDGKDVFFGEVTIYPGAGYEKFEKKEHDLFFGQPWAIGS